MPKYLALHEHIQDGTGAIEEFPERSERAQELAASMDCKVKDVFLTNGRYDVAVVLEAPDEMTAKRLALAVTSKGTATTEFQRAFTPKESDEIVVGLPHNPVEKEVPKHDSRNRSAV